MKLSKVLFTSLFVLSLLISGKAQQIEASSSQRDMLSPSENKQTVGLHPGELVKLSRDAFSTRL